MATVNKTIGSGVTRDYEDITSWEAADGGGDGLGNDDCTGLLYNDSIFTDDTVTIDFSANSIVLTAATGEEHNGQPGSGVEWNPVDNDTALLLSVPATISKLEISANGDPNSANPAGIQFAGIDYITIERCLISGFRCRDSSNRAYGIYNSNSAADHIVIRNNMIFDIAQENGSATTSPYGIRMIGTAATNLILNNTIHDVVGNGTGIGIGIAATANNKVKNNVVTDCDTCFSSGTLSYNLSSDETSTGDGALINKTSANQFVSNSSPYNLHLKTGADAIDAGDGPGDDADIPTEDIDADSRSGATCDMGADELNVSTPIYNASVISVTGTVQGVPVQVDKTLEVEWS